MLKLTPRQKELVEMYARGLTTKEIAYEWGVTYHCVTSHRKHIFDKLGLAPGNTVALLKLFYNLVPRKNT